MSKILLCEKLYKACTGEASINISFSDLEKNLQGNVKISFRHIEGYGHLGKASFLSRTFCPIDKDCCRCLVVIACNECCDIKELSLLFANMRRKSPNIDITWCYFEDDSSVEKIHPDSVRNIRTNGPAIDLWFLMKKN